MSAESPDNVVPVRSVQVRLARLGILGIVALFVFVQFFGAERFRLKHKGRPRSIRRNPRWNPLFSLCLFSRGFSPSFTAFSRGSFVCSAPVLVLLTAGTTYMVCTLDLSNHHVIVSPTGIVREVGTKTDPIRHEIEFAKTAYLHIVQVRGDDGPRYELVANAADGSQTRIPIFDMMRAALPQILETAARHGVLIGESENGEVIPAELRVEDTE